MSIAIMRHNHLFHIVCALAAILLLASCRSSKHVKPTSPEQPTINVTNPSISSGENANSATSSKPLFTPPANPNFTAKVKVTLHHGDQDIATSGMLRMRYNDVIQLTLVDPILGITEVGRMELSADSMLVIDRINKRYISAPYDEIAPLRNKNIDFPLIQNTFWEASQTDHFSIPIPASTPITLDLVLYDRGSSDKWEGHTKVSSKYVKTDVDLLLKNLGK